ncbi:MAG: pyridoxal phosphate-dependent aminotransferase [Clostridia bacterium]|nr:pyridoxal phosphate-dependent aminotransferase [Clostridia bacterium]
MYNEKMIGLGSKRSVIRELFEYGKKRAAEVGADKVYDYSLGNPSVPAPACVNKTIKQILDSRPSVAVHGYTSAQGDLSTRKAIAEYTNERFGCRVTADDFYMTCGAAASLTITLNALHEEGDEIVAIAPFFPEYRVFSEAAGYKLVVSRPIDGTLQPDPKDLSRIITPHTKAVILNSPNNPSGVVYTEESVKAVCALLQKKSAEFGRPIFIICDEPYREIVYDGVSVPYLPNYYDDVVVCYSFSKSLSLPGERIGYVMVNPKCKDARLLYAAVCGAGRALGYVCAPSLMQAVIEKVVRAETDVAAYKKNRDLLQGGLEEIGYTCVKPDGAFYLFVKSLEPDAGAFSDRAKEYGLLLVPGDDFCAPGYVRLAYCVSHEMIERSMPAFRALFESYRAR